MESNGAGGSITGVGKFGSTLIDEGSECEGRRIAAGSSGEGAQADAKRQQAIIVFIFLLTWFYMTLPFLKTKRHPLEIK